MADHPGGEQPHGEFIVPPNMTQDEIDDLIGVFRDDDDHILVGSASAIATAAAAATSALSDASVAASAAAAAIAGGLDQTTPETSIVGQTHAHSDGSEGACSPPEAAPVSVPSASPTGDNSSRNFSTSGPAMPAHGAVSAVASLPSRSSSTSSVQIDDESSKALALSRKRTREKKRRLDENKQLTDLTNLIKEIEGHSNQKNARQRTACTSFSSRADIIGRAILLLERLHERNQEQEREIANLNQQVQASKQTSKDVTAKLKGSAAAAMMMYPQPNGGVSFGAPGSSSCSGGNGGQVMMMMPMMMPQNGMFGQMMPMMNHFAQPAGMNTNATNMGAPCPPQHATQQQLHAQGQQQNKSDADSTQKSQSAEHASARQQQQQQPPTQHNPQIQQPSPQFPMNPMAQMPMPMQQGFGMQQPHQPFMMMQGGYPQHPNFMMQPQPPNSQVAPPYMMPTQVDGSNFPQSAAAQGAAGALTQVPQPQTPPTQPMQPPPTIQQPATQMQSNSTHGRKPSSPSSASSDGSNGLGGNLAHCA